jgi:hypothetical protein
VAVVNTSITVTSDFCAQMISEQGCCGERVSLGSASCEVYRHPSKGHRLEEERAFEVAHHDKHCMASLMPCSVSHRSLNFCLSPECHLQILTAVLLKLNMKIVYSPVPLLKQK